MASKKTVFYHHRKFTFLVFFSEFFLCLKCSSFSKINSHSCSLTETLVLHYFFFIFMLSTHFYFYFFFDAKVSSFPFCREMLFLNFDIFSIFKSFASSTGRVLFQKSFSFFVFLVRKKFFLFTSWLCRSMPKIFYPNENFSCIHCVDFKKDVALKEVVGSLKSRKLRFFYLCFWCRKFYALFFKGHFDVESKVA